MDLGNARAHLRAAGACCKAPQASAAESLANAACSASTFWARRRRWAAGKVPGGVVTAAGKGAGLGGQGSMAGSVVSTVTECDWVQPSDRRVPARGT